MRLRAMKLFVDIAPLPCPRPRIATRGKFAHAYYPASYKKWKEDFAAKLPPIDGPLAEPINLIITNRVLKPRTSKLHFPVGDVDNYAKSVMDGLTAAGYWLDDKQVVLLSVSKCFVTESPGIHIEIEPV